MSLLRHPSTVCQVQYRQAGSSLIEFSLIAAPVLMAGLGSVELAQWFFVKQAVSLALLEAGRAGITQHAYPQAMEKAFEQALLALYPKSAKQTSAQRLQQALHRRSQDTGGPPWQIEVLQPGPKAFLDFGNSQLAPGAQHGLAAIDNNYQTEQHQRYIARGWKQGRGPASGLSIYEANALVLRLTYLHEPALPGVKSLVRQLASGTQNYAARAMSSAGYLPISQEIRLTMQTHPLQWPALANGKIIGAGSPASAGFIAAAEPCAGIWCFKNEAGSASVLPSAPEKSGSATPVPDPPADGGPVPEIPEQQPGTETPAGPGTNPPGGAQDPECGATLCCLPG